MLTLNDTVMKLEKQAQYAINSKSRPLIYKALGAIEMARELGAISKDDYLRLDRLLVRDTLNNPKVFPHLHDF